MRLKLILILLVSFAFFSNCKDQSAPKINQSKILNKTETIEQELQKHNSDNTKDKSEIKTSNEEVEKTENIESKKEQLPIEDETEEKLQTREFKKPPKFEHVDPNIKPSNEKLIEIVKKYNLHFNSDHNTNNTKVEIVEVEKLWETLKIVLFKTFSRSIQTYMIYYAGSIKVLTYMLINAVINKKMLYYTHMFDLTCELSYTLISRLSVVNGEVKNIPWNNLSVKAGFYPSQLFIIDEKDSYHIKIHEISELEWKLQNVDEVDWFSKYFVDIGVLKIKPDRSMYLVKANGEEVFVGFDEKNIFYKPHKKKG